MIVKARHSLKKNNTFNIDVTCDHFVELHSRDEILNYFSDQSIVTEKRLILGGGSNMLFTQNFQGTVIHICNKGIELVENTDNHVLLRAAAGEIWDDLVQHCVKNRFYGIENLACIPGTVGASPVQNIGAFGKELKDVLDCVEIYDLERKEIVIYNRESCHLNYRNSIFKQKLKEKILILSVTIKLSKMECFNVKYGQITQELQRLGSEPTDIRKVYTAISNLRKSKLPDPEEMGNAGSFFKNPIIPDQKYEALKNQFPGIVAYKTSEGMKLAAGWLIESCGYLGKISGNAAVHNKQALVIVNKGNASGREILQLSNEIIDSVHEKFNILLEPEVNII